MSAGRFSWQLCNCTVLGIHNYRHAKWTREGGGENVIFSIAIYCRKSWPNDVFVLCCCHFSPGNGLSVCVW